MAYRYSQVDQQNMRWMAADNSKATLRRLRLSKGKLRGLGKFDVEFNYPITAIAGENGSGKSTLLAIVACGYHNRASGFKLPDQQKPYFTFGDFFIQSTNEMPQEGIDLWYGFLHQNWHGREDGLGFQKRRKKPGGRWTDYAGRINRNVVYFGIQRVVPHYERSAHKSYRRQFSPGTMDAVLRNRIADIAGRIIGKTYDDFDLYQHSKYTLPVATCNGVEYSGFNMGAGESAVFDILTTLFAAGQGALLIIDEIELGLHEKAQRQFIKELKLLCQELRCQIICSTHSHIILSSLPPEGRFYVEAGTDESNITVGISPDLACGKLSGSNVCELKVFVEDGAAKAILENWLPQRLRRRLHIMPIGSSEAVYRQLAANYLEEGAGNCVAVLDGDKRSTNASAISKVTGFTEASTDEEKAIVREWAAARLSYIPGNEWPEKWLVDLAIADVDFILDEDEVTLVQDWGMDNSQQIVTAFSAGLRAGKHNEFYQIADEVDQQENQVRADIIRFVKRNHADAMNDVIDRIEELLEADNGA